MPDRRADTIMNEFVKKNGGFLFFKNKYWRQKLFEYFSLQRKSCGSGHFKRNETEEAMPESLEQSKAWIEKKFNNVCRFFSLPLYQGSKEALDLAAKAGYKAVFTGPKRLILGIVISQIDIASRILLPASPASG
jgi:hypothetical protein